ncbi:unnamed protein product [Kuraishia capsulata CBS 1993]|uniref:Amino acid permease/ SLC12A domain-containing protein n=1 Tax=Kuraishia capsulata CBS 1993 TaxID=1382522 RepID=W6MFB5_9ASCO|nr:uncharacterized protein KUCA_T00000406001 [Kuraishia capsulata CBS 1993]CDK24444.1 unnamed protein product [Kuraishia capsulata CBS 1993]
MSRFLKNFKDVFIPVAPLVLPTGEVEIVPRNSHMASIPSNQADNKNLKTLEDIDMETSSGISENIFDIGNTHRKLLNRHIQLIGIGGTIGVALFVAIGTALSHGGPLNLFLGFTFWSIPILMVTATCAEMVCYLPISSPFIRLAGRCVDEALETTAGWNFWFLEGSLIPFELTLFNTLIHYWRDDYSAAIPIAVQVVLYFLINVFAVKLYGESEFWLAIGKVILAVGLICFTFITMVGGNPQHDPYGFRYWRDPGVMNEYIHTGSLGRFQGFLACVISACFTIAGPEYVSMVAGEAVNPRKNLPNAYKQVAYRLTLFFVGGALCVGIVCAYNDPLLLDAISNSKPGAGSSPYVIAMTNMHIKVLPHIVNVMLITSSFSAGNSYTYCSSRTLYALALNGKAPFFFAYCNKNGVPIYAVLASLCWAMLAFLQLGETARTVLNWIVNLVTAAQLMNFLIICVTYWHFFRACKVQGIDRNSFTFKGWGQPYLSIVAGTLVFIMLWVQGYTVFIPGGWSVTSFLFSYLMIFIDIAIFLFWKVYKRTKYRIPAEVDLVSGLSEIEEHERIYYAHLEKHGDDPVKWYDRVSAILFGK